MSASASTSFAIPSLNFESDVVLIDGSIVHVRPGRRDDREMLVEFFKMLSQESVYLRFFGAGISPESAVDMMVPAPDRFSLIALRESKIVAHAAYYLKEQGHAEVALVVADSCRKKGLGTILVGQLSEIANRSGITEFEAIVSPENYTMIELVRNLGFPLKQTIEPGSIRITFGTSFLPEAVERFESREAIAAVAAVRSFLNPSSIALLGASRQKEAIGGALFSNIIQGDFSGVVYPINSKSPAVQSVPAYPSISACPGPIDIALVAVPAHAVVDCAKECAKKGTRGLVVISAGFSESGKEGAKTQQELVRVCQESGMRIIGPNCMGIVNTDPRISLNGQFSPFRPTRGRVGFLSQSGALGIAVLDITNKLGLGLSSFVSVGNKADISGNDLLQYWETDENTDVILLYLESFGNPRKFSRIARRVARKKPIIAVKSGRGSAGFRATQSHTGALLAASDITVDALFKQSGVIRTDTLEEMFDVAALLATQPVPKGNRVGIVTNAGGAGILAADASESLGLKVPEFSQETQTALRAFLATQAGVKNPVDMIASAPPENYGKAIRAVANDPNIDSLIVIFIPPIAVKPEHVADEILRAAKDLGGKLPILATFMASRGINPLLSDGCTRIPTFPFPESAARALAHATNYSTWLWSSTGKAPLFQDIRKAESAAIVASALKDGSRWLSQEEAERLLSCYGIPVIKSLKAVTPEEAGRAAQELGGRVVLKASAPGLVHKTEAGAVKVGLEGQAEVFKAAQTMVESLASKRMNVSDFLIQPMLRDSVEMFVGITHDPSFGPVVATGAGGIFVELLKDVSIRLTPLTDKDAHDMVHSLKTFPLLSGYRGSRPADVSALEDIITRIGCLAEDIPEIVELDLNPVMVLGEGKGACAVDYRIRIAQSRRDVPVGAKRGTMIAAES